ncbi:MAG: 5-methyltetrahydrofolate--homocysteine methyltransferase [Verrucomicrobia bacterium]|nr:MAG: 5-methyltetrahydrofolate--homocysteine methyltransferase [Verrucomicrobiota bacterium]
MKPALASLYQAIELRQPIPPLLIGERMNANGSKRFRERLLADDWAGCVEIGVEQEKRGAQVLDVCVAYAGRDEKRDMLELVRRLAGTVKVPLMIDSTTPDVIEAALKIYPGRCIVNSINLEDGGKYLRRICALLKKYGAAAVALTINERGMAMTAADKIATAKNICDIACGEFGLRQQDLLFDALTFTIGAGDETLRDSALQTLEGIRGIKAALPGVGCVLGLSNISFGLASASRKILNSVFLHEAVQAGLDAAIVDAGNILPLATLDTADREICLDLLHDRRREADKKPLTIFIEHFQKKAGEVTTKPTNAEEEKKPAETALTDRIVAGSKEGLEDLLEILRGRMPPVEIINRILIPAMRHVGELFGRGELLLPFVLQSAEAMKRAVSLLEPHMPVAQEGHATKVLLATVQGDVHDIGKNLVDIILTNNGYKVFNLGIKVPAEVIIEKARALKPQIIGLSGLLVKSALVMKESMRQYREAELDAPILLGGAALTRKFVAQDCAPDYDQPVVYCADAFAGLQAVRDFEAGKLHSTTFDETAAAPFKPGLKNVEISRDNPVPQPPFLGLRHIREIPVTEVFPYVNTEALFRGRWGYRRAKLPAEDYAKILAEKVQPLYAKLQQESIAEGLLQPQAAYGWFRCFSRGEELVVRDESREYIFGFPRQAESPHLCIADFFKTEAEGGDIAGFFVVTIGAKLGERSQALFASDQYHDYLMLHGFGVEVTDALAEYWHAVMRRELGIGKSDPATKAGFVTQDYQGSRYGFGYPACPDMGAHIPVFALLQPDALGITLTENMQMVPEFTTSAIVAHHPQAKYFAV